MINLLLSSVSASALLGQGSEPSQAPIQRSNSALLTNSSTANIPPEAQVGDFLIAYAGAGNNSSLWTDADDPPGWRRQAESQFGVAKGAIWTRFYDGTEGSTVSFAPSSGGIFDVVTGIVAFTGVNTTAPLTTLPIETGSDTNTTTLTLGTQTVLNNEETLVGLVTGGQSGGISYTPPTGFVELLDGSSATGGANAASISIAKREDVDAGDYNGQFTSTVSVPYTGFLMSLQGINATLPNYAESANWRLRSTGSSRVDGLVALGELKFRDRGGPIDLSGTTATASSEFNGTLTADHLIRNNTEDWASDTNGTPHDVFIDFPVATALTQITLISRYTGSQDAFEQGPTNFQLDYTTDGGTTWNTVLNVNGLTWTAYGEVKEFNINPLPDIDQFDLPSVLTAASGQNVFNRGQSAVSFVPQGGVQVVTDQPAYPDGALAFDGVDDFYVSDYNIGLSVGNVFTIDLDFVVNENYGSSRRWIVGQGGPNGNFGWSVWYNNTSSGLRFSIWGEASGQDPNDLDTGVIPTTGQRIRMRIDNDGTTLRVYIDGVLSVSQASPVLTSTGNGDFVLGQRGTNYNSDWFNGWIGGFRIIKDEALTGSDSGYDVNDGSTPTLSAVGANYQPDGAWTWFNHERGVNINGADVIGVVDQNGFAKVHDLTNQTTVNLRSTPIAVDDHVNPAIVHLVNGSILAFAPSRNSLPHYQFESVSINDASAFGPEQDNRTEFGTSTHGYAQAHQLEGETNDPVYLFFRGSSGGDRDMFYSQSDSTTGWNTWASATEFLSNNGDNNNWPPYFISNKTSSTRIDFCLTDGSPNGTTTNSVYHMYFEGGVFYDTAGNALTLPITPAVDLTPIYDGTPARGWVWDITTDASNNPAILYARFPDGATDHVMARAVYDGSTWTNEDIVVMGDALYPAEPYYSSGGCFDENNPDIAFISVNDNEGIYQINKFTVDGNGIWTGTPKTFETADALRPFIPLGSSNVVYFTGRYTEYESYATIVKQFNKD